VSVGIEGHVTLTSARDNRATSTVAFSDIVANLCGAHLAIARPVVPPRLVDKRLHGGSPAGWNLHDDNAIPGVNFVGAAHRVVAPVVEVADMVVVLGDGHCPSVPRVDCGHLGCNIVGCSLVAVTVVAYLRIFLVTRPGGLSLGISLVDGSHDVVCSFDSPRAELGHLDVEGLFGRQLRFRVD